MHKIYIFTYKISLVQYLLILYGFLTVQAINYLKKPVDVICLLIHADLYINVKYLILHIK